MAETQMQRARQAPPRASALLESLRGLGYSTAAAIADLIDNSIAAGARTVRVEFTWAQTASRITVLDDGIGMTDSALERAMTLGDRSPLEARAERDLGRFGMGLKTSSFSQCRRLTVASTRQGARACLRWDLDELAASPQRGWLLFEGPSVGSEDHLRPLDGMPSGTLVLWEVLDRIVTPGFTVDDFNDAIDVVEAHLAMTFHRLLSEHHTRRLRLLLNGREVDGWDPFMTGHPAKPWASPVQRTATQSGVIEVECHVLPHKDLLPAYEFEAAAGPNGWTAQQGFYVYRNQRLLVAGGWLGLGGRRPWNREEAYRLARIRIDIPNSADAEWKIDIRKATARPPVSVRGWLTRYAEDTRARARRVFAHRGVAATLPGGTSVMQAWRAEQTSTGMRYRIEESHPAIESVIAVAGAHAPLVRAMLRVIEATVPVQRIWIDTVDNRDTPRTRFEGEPPEAVLSVLTTLFEDMTSRRGMSPEAARRALLGVEPFSNYPDLVARVTGQRS